MTWTIAAIALDPELDQALPKCDEDLGNEMTLFTAGFSCKCFGFDFKFQVASLIQFIK